MTAEDIAETVLGKTPKHAPYKDEQTAELERKLIAKDNEITTLEKEVKRLENENKTLLNRADNSGLDSGEGANAMESVNETAGGTFEATYYSAFCPTGCTGVTATGIDVSNSIYHEGKRIIAVDPSVIPLGAIVKVTTPNESFEAVAADTGGDIKGKRIDILVESTEKAYSLGRHDVKVEVLK